MSLPKEGQAHSFQECEMMEVIEVMTLPPVVTPKHRTNVGHDRHNKHAR